MMVLIWMVGTEAEWYFAVLSQRNDGNRFPLPLQFLLKTSVMHEHCLLKMNRIITVARTDNNTSHRNHNTDAYHFLVVLPQLPFSHLL